MAESGTLTNFLIRFNAILRYKYFCSVSLFHFFNFYSHVAAATYVTSMYFGLKFILFTAGFIVNQLLRATLLCRSASTTDVFTIDEVFKLSPILYTLSSEPLPLGFNLLHFLKCIYCFVVFCGFAAFFFVAVTLLATFRYRSLEFRCFISFVQFFIPLYWSDVCDVFISKKFP